MDLIAYQITHNQSIFQQKFIHSTNHINNSQSQYHKFIILAQIPYVNFQNFRLLVKLSIDRQNQRFTLSFRLMDKIIFRISNEFQKIFQMRKLLNIGFNFKEFKLKINPENGYLSIQRNFFVSQLMIFKNINNFFDLVDNVIQQNIQIVNYLFINILYNFSQMIQNPQYQKAFFKNCILHSSCYTWKLLQGITSKSWKLQKYQELKELYKHNYLQIKQNKYNCIDKIYGTLRQPYDFYKFDEFTDQQIANYFLPNLEKFLNQNSKLIQQKVNFSKQSLQYLLQKKQGKINTGNQIYRLKIHQFKQSDKQSIMHQCKILSKLPNQEMIGLPKYYYPKKNNKHLFQITNLYNSMTLDVFLQKNKKSISIFTKSNILNQIIRTIQYLRNNKIVSNNLKFSNIYVKEKKIVKLFSFINSHHQQLQRPNYKNSFPFYFKDLNPNHIFNNEDERLDVFSFSFILYSMIFDKSILNIKDSALKKINQNFLIQSIQSKKKYYFSGCVQFGDVILKYLEFLCLNGYCFPFEGEHFKNRPFLDWIVILMKFLQQYFEGLVNFLLPYQRRTKLI